MSKILKKFKIKHKTKRISLNLYKNKYDEIKEASDKLGMSMSTFVGLAVVDLLAKAKRGEIKSRYLMDFDFQK